MNELKLRSGGLPGLVPFPEPLAEQSGLRLPSEDNPEGRLVRSILATLREALTARATGGPGEVFDLSSLPATALALLDDTLGKGEVEVLVNGQSTYKIHESVLPGLWRVRTFDSAGTQVGEHAEVGDIPQVVRAAAEHGTLAELPIGEPPKGTMNAQPLLAELRARMAALEPGRPNHVISFTLLPLTPEDMAWLESSLGRGPVEIDSRGYGRCRISLTGRRGVWSVQYFNAMGQLILDTLEVGDVPAAALAGTEDFEDSALRLAELLEAP